MWSREALCVARSSEILYSALSGASWTAFVYSATAASQLPARAASSPLRKARPAAQPETSTVRTIPATSLRFNNGTPCERPSGSGLLANAFLTGHPDRLAAASVGVLHDD